AGPGTGPGPLTAASVVLPAIVLLARVHRERQPVLLWRERAGRKRRERARRVLRAVEIEDDLLRSFRRPRHVEEAAAAIRFLAARRVGNHKEQRQVQSLVDRQQSESLAVALEPRAPPNRQ